MTFKRYAAYFVPDGLWGDFGAAWLGWDNRTGAVVEPMVPELAELTERPRKYGFHATIRSPFRLAEEATQDAVAAELDAVCSKFDSIPLPSLKLSRIGPFFALTAPGEWAELQTVADCVVEALDPFRAPLTEEELARRRAGTLSDRQEELLARWGYPYVKEQFRFHLTITGPTKTPAEVEPELRARLEVPMQEPLVMDSLSLLGEAEDGQFHQIARFAF